MIDFVQARRNMVDCQLRTYDVNDRAVLTAMVDVPREIFVAEGRADLAFLDVPVPGADGARPLLAAMVFGRMVQALGIESHHRVLDVAGGSGYSTAILSALGGDVTMLEETGFATDSVTARLAGLGAAAKVVTGPLDKGAPADAPFDRILVNGVIGVRPDALLAQLSPDDGRLVTLWNDGGATRALLFVRSGEAVGTRGLFDANGPVLQAFQAKPGFVF